MGLVIAASAIAFVTTEMDDLLVMFVLFSKAGKKREKAAVIAGKYTGLFLLVAAGKLLADSLRRFPCENLLGLLGVVPIVIGIRYAAKEYSREDAQAEQGKNGSVLHALGLLVLFLETCTITLANGGDNIAVCLSFFSGLARADFLVACTVFAAMQALWCLIAVSVMNAGSIRSYIEESKGVVIPALFIVLGLYMLVKSGAVVWLLSLGGRAE